MKRYNNIYQHIITPDNIHQAILNASKDKRHYREVSRVFAHMDKRVAQLVDMLSNKTYEVSKYTSRIIHENGKERVLNKLPFFPDRVVQWAIMQQIDFIFLDHFCYHSCASIPNRGIDQAHKLASKYTKMNQYCLKIDVRKFYDNIDHEVLKKQLLTKFKDKALIALLFRIIDSYETTPNSGKGLPLGSYLSQYLANFNLSFFDHWLKQKKGQRFVIRYMDDVCIFDNDKAALHTLLREIHDYMRVELKLELKSNYQVFPIKARGVDFVGYRFFGDYILLRKRVANAFKRLSLRLQRKAELTEKDVCALMSYLGMFRRSDSYWFFKKYFMPLKGKVKAVKKKLGRKFRYRPPKYTPLTHLWEFE